MKAKLAASLAIGAAGWALALAPAGAAETQRKPFGALPDGRQVEAVTLTNAKGVSATIINWGAAIQALMMPDK